MNVTKDGLKDRQLHLKDYLYKISAEQKEYAEASVYQRITENNDIITEFGRIIIETDFTKNNLDKAYKIVKPNKDKVGIDGIQVDEFLLYLRENQSKIK